MKPHRKLAICVLLIFLAAELSNAQTPELVVQTGHSFIVHSVAYGPDGKSMASGSADNTVKLWDVETGVELRTLRGHSSDVTSVAFTPDGNTLASGSNDGTIKLWNVSRGTELRTLFATKSYVNSIAFAPNGQILASGSSDTLIKLWDVSSGAELRTLIGHEDAVVTIAFARDGKTLASGSLDHTIRLWNLATGAEPRTLKGHSDWVWSVAFSPNGQSLASGSQDHSVKLWNVSTGQVLRTLNAELVRSVAFSPDGMTLASGSWDNTVKLWNVSTGAELRNFTGHSQYVDCVAFSPDGKTLASGSWDHTVRLWEVSTGTELRTLGGNSKWIFSIALSPDGNILAAGSGASIKLWDVATGADLRTLNGHSDNVRSVAFSPDGKILASGSEDKTVRLWDVSTGTILRTLTGHSYFVYSVAFSPDGQTLASGSFDETIKLWKVATSAELRTLRGHSNAVYSVAFSPNGKVLASGSEDKTIKLWNVENGMTLRTFQQPSAIFSVAFSPDGKTLASGGLDSTVRLFNGTTGKVLRTFEGSGSIRSVAFNPDGKTLASGHTDFTARIWDLAGTTKSRTLEGSAPLYSILFSQSQNQKYLVTGAADGLKIWDPNSGNALASLAAIDGHEWIVITPDGLFDGSPAAWNRIIWRFNNNTFDHAPVEAFFNEFYYPGLLTDIIAGKNPKAKSNIAQKDRRQPKLRLTLAESPGATSSIGGVGGRPPQGARNVAVKIDVAELAADKEHASGSGAQDVRLFRNGSLLKVWRGDVLKGKSSATLEATVPIVSGDNRFTAYAFNHDNIKSSDATLVVNGSESLGRRGTAYVLAVGVNVYDNPNYNLKYALADAEEFAGEIKRQQDSLKNYEGVEIVFLRDKDATKANILEALNQLATKAQPEDAVIVYFSGHGTAAQQRFYLIPHDLGYQGPRTKLSAADLKAVLDHSISDRELEAGFEKIDAGQLLMVIDACNSGQALDSEEKRRGPMNSKGLAQLAYEKGMYILTAAQSYQAAWEASRLGHGFLTYALVEEGLKKGTADREPKNNEIVLREWLDFATERVPQLQEEKLKETPQQKDQQGRELEFVFIEGDETIKDPTKRSIQRPRVFYRREAEPTPFIVARPETVTPARN